MADQIPRASRESLAELEVRALRALGSKRLSEAETATRLWLDRAIETGADDLSMARIDTFLAEICRERRKYVESRHFYDEALLSYERWYRSNLKFHQFGKPSTLRARTSLRACFAHFTGAALAGRAAVMQALGQDDDNAHDLALAQRRLRLALRLEESELRRADTIASMGLLLDLARVYLARANPKAAQPLLRRVLAITQTEIARPPERFAASEKAVYRRNLRNHAAAVQRMLDESNQP